MDETVAPTDTACANVSSAPGRPVHPTIIVTESLVEALAALSADREMIATTKRILADLWYALDQRDARIARSVTDIRHGCQVAERMVSARARRIARPRRRAA